MLSRFSLRLHPDKNHHPDATHFFQEFQNLYNDELQSRFMGRLPASSTRKRGWHPPANFNRGDLFKRGKKKKIQPKVQKKKSKLDLQKEEFAKMILADDRDGTSIQQFLEFQFVKMLSLFYV